MAAVATVPGLHTWAGLSLLVLLTVAVYAILLMALSEAARWEARAVMAWFLQFKRLPT
jgi:hypothetical protein